jgi:hypothetical protein
LKAVEIFFLKITFILFYDRPWRCETQKQRDIQSVCKIHVSFPPISYLALQQFFPYAPIRNAGSAVFQIQIVVAL